MSRFLKVKVLSLLSAGALMSAQAAVPTLDDRQAAAQIAADGSDCKNLNFYWEIGDAAGNKRSGNGPGGLALTKVQRTTSGYIASAGKWLFGAYVAEKRGGLPTDADLPYLTLKSGHHEQGNCGFALTPTGQRTVFKCGEPGNNPKTVADGPHLENGQTVPGRYYYEPGHFEALAALDGSLGLASATALQLGPIIGGALHIGGLSYGGVVLAGQARIDAANYALFLRQVLDGSLRMASLLGASSVCTSTAAAGLNQTPLYCNRNANQDDRTAFAPPLQAALDSTPTLPDGTTAIANGEPWRYSLGHFVEKDGSFSSAGQFGFYPWIDASRSWYGVVSRYEMLNGTATQFLTYQASLLCGRSIRNAWLHAVPSGTP